ITTAAMASTAITTADATRLGRSPDREAVESSLAGNGALSFTASRSGACHQPAEPALAAPIFGDRRLERATVEIGPIGRNEYEFAVGGLPHQEIRQALLAAGADDEVWIGQVGRVEMLAEEFGGDVARRQISARHLHGDALGGTRDFLAAAIVEGDHEE